MIVVFTKYDQFKRNIKLKLEDEGRNPGIHLAGEVESMFNQHYRASLSGSTQFVRLESKDFFNQYTHPNFCPVGMHDPDQRCTELIEVTANALSGAVVALMLAVQSNNLELNVNQAIKW